MVTHSSDCLDEADLDYQGIAAEGFLINNKGYIEFKEYI